MADNVTIPASGTGTATPVVASDDISGVHFQRVKMVIGADGTNDGDVATGNPLPVKEKRAATPSQSSVNDTASSTTLLSANSSRLGATIYNDSDQVLYLKLGATASTTSFTVKLAPGGYYEVPFGYTGIIDGIWAADSTGAARVTELAA